MFRVNTLRSSPLEKRCQESFSCRTSRRQHRSSLRKRSQVSSNCSLSKFSWSARCDRHSHGEPALKENEDGDPTNKRGTPTCTTTETKGPAETREIDSTRKQTQKGQCNHKAENPQKRTLMRKVKSLVEIQRQPCRRIGKIFAIGASTRQMYQVKSSIS